MNGSLRVSLAIAVALVLLSGASVSSMSTSSAATSPAALPGAQLWATRYNAHRNGDDSLMSLAVSPDGSRVFVTGSSEGAAGLDYATASYDASTGTLVWLKRYDGPAQGNDGAVALAVSPDGSTVFVTGSSFRRKSRSDFETIAYDAASGQMIWAKRYDGPAGRDDHAAALGLSPDGSTLFVTGTTRQVGSGQSRTYDYATVAYEAASGRTVWTATFDDRRHGFDSPTAIAVSPSGTMVFVTGSAEVKGDIQGFGITYGTIAYQASNGARLWVSAPNVSDCESDYPRSIVISPDGATVFVTGLGTFGCNEFFGGYLTVAYDASMGKPLWVRGNADYDSGSRGAALAMSGAGTTLFQTGTLGQLGDANLGDYETIAWTLQGDQRWSSDYEGPSGPVNGATAIALTHDSSTVLVTGWSKGKSSGRDIATIAYDAANGSELWVSRYDGPAGSTDTASSVGISPDGSTAFVAGSSTGSGSGLDYVVIAYAV